MSFISTDIVCFSFDLIFLDGSSLSIGTYREEKNGDKGREEEGDRGERKEGESGGDRGERIQRERRGEENGEVETGEERGKVEGEGTYQRRRLIRRVIERMREGVEEVEKEKYI